MTLDQLRVFSAVAEHGHVTRAARELSMSQSAASAAIAALEASCKIKLFDRVGRGIELTEIGRNFLPEARALLDRAAMARLVLQDLAGAAAGTVAIAASLTIATYWLPKRIAAFNIDNPDIRLNVVIRNSHDVESAVVEGEVNVGLVEGPSEHPSLSRRTIDTDQLVMVLAADHPPVARNASGQPDLRALPWVVREKGSGTRLGLEDLAASDGLSLDDLDLSLELPSNEAVREAVQAGAGATIISRHVVASAIAAGQLVEFSIDLPQREFALVLHRERYSTLAQQALVEHLAGPGPELS